MPAYNNISKKCILCLQEKFEIITHLDQENLLNKKSELISKCRHENKLLLKIKKTNDQSKIILILKNSFYDFLII